MDAVLRGRLKRLKQFYSLEFGEKSFLNRSQYKIYLALLTGCTPDDLEVEIIFNSQEFVAVGRVDEIISKKIDVGTDYSVLEMYRALDENYKGYVNLKDLLRVWRKSNSSLSWKVLRDCFLTLAPRENLDYDTFKMFLTLYLIEP